MGMTGQRIEPSNRVYLIAEKFQANTFFVGGGGINFDHISADSESSAREIHVVTLI